MSNLSRRQFFYFTGSALAALGFSQFNLPQQANHYGKVLAKSTPRKLALLVGINNYSSQPLLGCFNDVELQRHLLIHRFGFNPKDIYTLTDEQATRQGILEAFEEHLIKQAKPEDVVVYH
ncbi:MAG: caspase family protein, partial [Coleofasciculaceae cyanobacterium]